MTKNKSPLRYPGGKTRACKTLDNILIQYYNINEFNTIISPFLGGGSFEFYIQNKYNLNIKANDKFTPLYNFWISCKLHKESLCNTLTTKLNTIDKSTFIDLRKKNAAIEYRTWVSWMAARCVDHYIMLL